MMLDYVLYCFDGHKLSRCERFTARGDQEAIDEAFRLRGKEAAGLWCGDRKVMQFDTELTA